MKEIRQVLGGGGKTWEGFVGEKEDFVSRAGLDGEPAKVDEGGVDVLPGLGGG